MQVSTIEVPDERRREKPDANYGDLIERELIIPSIRQSVFKEDWELNISEIELQLEEFQAVMREICRKGPERPSPP